LSPFAVTTLRTTFVYVRCGCHTLGPHTTPHVTRTYVGYLAILRCPTFTRFCPRHAYRALPAPVGYNTLLVGYVPCSCHTCGCCAFTVYSPHIYHTYTFGLLHLRFTRLAVHLVTPLRLLPTFRLCYAHRYVTRRFTVLALTFLPAVWLRLLRSVVRTVCSAHWLRFTVTYRLLRVLPHPPHVPLYTDATGYGYPTRLHVTTTPRFVGFTGALHTARCRSFICLPHACLHCTRYLGPSHVWVVPHFHHTPAYYRTVLGLFGSVYYVYPPTFPVYRLRCPFTTLRYTGAHTVRTLPFPHTDTRTDHHLRYHLQHLRVHTPALPHVIHHTALPFTVGSTGYHIAVDTPHCGFTRTRVTAALLPTYRTTHVTRWLLLILILLDRLRLLPTFPVCSPFTVACVLPLRLFTTPRYVCAYAYVVPSYHVPHVTLPGRGLRSVYCGYDGYGLHLPGLYHIRTCYMQPRSYNTIPVSTPLTPLPPHAFPDCHIYVYVLLHRLQFTTLQRLRLPDLPFSHVLVVVRGCVLAVVAAAFAVASACHTGFTLRLRSLH